MKVKDKKHKMLCNPQFSRERERERERSNPAKLCILLCCCAVLISQNVYSAECSENYNLLSHVNSSTFLAPVRGICQVGGYAIKEIPDELYPVYNGFIMGSEITLCNNGHLSGGVCVSYEPNNCKNTHYDTSIESTTFMAPVNDLCQVGGYASKTIPDELYALYNGMIMGSEVSLCGGKRYSGGSCVDYVQGDCPTNYKDLVVTDTTFDKLASGKCGTGYSKYTINQQCNDSTTDSMCAILCSNNLLYTDIGTCAALCDYGVTALKIRKQDGDILSFPLYKEKQITPSLNVDLGDGVCYVNLIDGNAHDALNFKDNQTGKTYHTVY